MNTSKDISDGDTDNEKKTGLKFILKDSENWNKQTIHIKFPAMEPKDSDESFVAWCRTDAKGSLVDKSDLPKVEDHEDEEDYRFCIPCCKKARENGYKVSDIGCDLE